MIKHAVLFTLLAGSILLAQRGGAPTPAKAEAGVTTVAPATPLAAPNVTFDRILKADAEPQNWLTYSGTLMSQRYSKLTQINAANVSDLQLKWVFQLKPLDKHEATPLVVNGVMYTIQNTNTVLALDAKTGKQLWVYTYTPNADARNCCGSLSRGLAISGNSIFLATYDAHMIALSATTGMELWNTRTADPKEGSAFTHAPLVVKDKVIAGTAGGEFGVRGFIAAWDVNTGKEVWRFNTVPGPGEPGNETWSGDSWQHGGAPIWVTGSYDPESNLTYWGTGNPGPDWDGTARLGDNLYSCSVIALDSDTGKLKWHYQFSPHNEFDWDSTQVPVLADIDWQGRARKVMLWANRNGMTYVLDRITGEFLKGGPFTKVNWATGFDAKGRPILDPAIVPTPQGTLVYPGNQGGTNWYNPSFSPRTGLFYIPTFNNSSSVYSKGAAPPEYHQGQTFSGPFPRGGPRGADDTYASVQAIDPKTGERKWEYRQSQPGTDAGIMTTASDLLFSGARDGSFYALDARDGKLLWQTYLGGGVANGPMTYMVDGKQYVTVMAGSAMMTFGLK
jgi:alcohol dehydrogenase (cytochrome c)